MTHLKVATLCSVAAVVGGLCLWNMTPRAQAQVKDDDIVVKDSGIPPLKLDKCPVSRSNFDRLQMGVPEYAIMDAMPCIKGEVVREFNIGTGRRPIPIRVWKFPRDGGGYLVVTTTGYEVSSKQWE